MWWRRTSAAGAGRGGRWSAARWSAAAWIQSPSSDQQRGDLINNISAQIEHKIVNSPLLGSWYSRLHLCMKYWVSSVSDSKSIVSGSSSTFRLANFSTCSSTRHTWYVKYTIWSMVCKASCHPVLSPSHVVMWSFDHSVTRSLGHSVTRSLGHSVIRSFGHSVNRSLGHLVNCHSVTYHPFILIVSTMPLTD